MKPIFEPIQQVFKTLLHLVAKWLDDISKGRVTSTAITIFGLLMHLPIAIMIARGRFFWAAMLLLMVGLLAMLSHELARLQKNENNSSDLIDAAATFKEVILYTGAAFFLAGGQHPRVAVWAVVACGAALSASYIKSKGETLVANDKNSLHIRLNKMIADGVLPFQIRMFVLVVGLLTGQLLVAVAGIAILSSITAMQRLVGVASKLG